MSKGWRDIQVSQELYDEMIAVKKKIAKTAIPAPEKVQKQKAPKKTQKPSTIKIPEKTQT